MVGTTAVGFVKNVIKLTGNTMKAIDYEEENTKRVTALELTGGPAHGGLTVLDAFAIEALGFLTCVGYTVNFSHEERAVWAYDQAEAYFQEGLALAQELGQRGRIACLLYHLGIAVGKRGAHDKAEEYFQRTLEIAQELEQYDLISYALRNLGIAASKRGMHNQAEEYYQKALTVAQNSGHPEWLDNLPSAESQK